MDLHVLRCPDHEWTIFRKCLSVCLHVCLKNFEDIMSQELVSEIDKLYIELQLDIL